MNMPVAIQLYTLRDEMQKDFVGTLEKVADMGYKGVELAGYGGLTAPELKACLDRLGLKPAGSHIGIEQLTQNLDQVMEYNLELGNQYIVCPWETYESKEDFLKAAKTYNEIGRKCAEKGLVFCYHNHQQEFVSFDGEYGLDVIYGNSEPEYVKAELDVYWATYAGVDPVDYIGKLSGRCPLVHLKDMEAGESRDFAEVGEGIIDMKSIISASKAAGAKWLIVEQDRCKRPSLESAKISLENLKEMESAW